MSDGKISYDEPLETLANILEAIIDTILNGSTGVKREKLSSFATTPIYIFYIKRWRKYEYNYKGKSMGAAYRV